MDLIEIVEVIPISICERGSDRVGGMKVSSISSISRIYRYMCAMCAAHEDPLVIAFRKKKILNVV